MILELLLFTAVGIGGGIFTGLTPGVHVNTIGAIMLGLTLPVNPYYLAVAIIAMAITHTIFDFVPSVFLGAPDPSTALSVLPGHQLLLEGRGLEAIYLTVVGGIGVILASFLALPALLLVIPLLYEAVRPYLALLLAGMGALMMATEPGVQKVAGLGLFLLSGLLGVATLHSPLFSSAILFPVFTGLFGLSTLLLSLGQQTALPDQSPDLPAVDTRLAVSGVLKGLLSGVLVGTLPGVGAAQATILTQEVTRRKSIREFLVAVGAINTVVSLFSLVALYTISRPRSGAAIFVQQLLPEFGFPELLLLMGVSLVATGIAGLLVLRLIHPLLRLFQSIDYTVLTVGIILFLIALVILLTGLLGLLVLGVSTAIGLLAPLYGVKRSHLMGVLLLPLILFYTGLAL